MAGTTLVSFDVPAGEKALKALEEHGTAVAVALWAKTTDYDEPRLFIASPDLDSVSRFEARTRVSEAVQPAFTRFAPNIIILRMSDRFVVALRNMFAHTSSVDGMRLGGQLIGDRYVEDAYVYLIR